MENWCHPCQQEGKSVVGKFQVGSHFYCFGHAKEMREKERTPYAAPVDGPGQAPAVSLPPVTAEPIRRRGRPPKSKTNGHTPLVKPRIGRPPKSEHRIKENFSKNSTISEMLVKLRGRRAALNEAITALEMAEKVLAQSEELI